MHQPHIAMQFRVRLQQAFIAFQLLHPALGVIGAPDRQDQLAIAQLRPDGDGAVAGFLADRAFLDIVPVNAHRRAGNLDRASLILNRFRHPPVRQRRAFPDEIRVHVLANNIANFQKALRHMDEVHRVARDVKADHVAGKQAVDDFAPPRQHVEHVRGRERGVMEEGNLHIRAQLAQIPRHQPQIVVMHPDHSTRIGQNASFEVM